MDAISYFESIGYYKLELLKNFNINKKGRKNNSSLIYIFYASGRSGKSTFIKLIDELYGVVYLRNLEDIQCTNNKIIVLRDFDNNLEKLINIIKGKSIKIIIETNNTFQENKNFEFIKFKDIIPKENTINDLLNNIDSIKNLIN